MAGHQGVNNLGDYGVIIAYNSGKKMLVFVFNVINDMFTDLFFYGTAFPAGCLELAKRGDFRMIHLGVEMK
jgi:hypothetical protein